MTKRECNEMRWAAATAAALKQQKIDHVLYLLDQTPEQARIHELVNKIRARLEQKRQAALLAGQTTGEQP